MKNRFTKSSRKLSLIFLCISLASAVLFGAAQCVVYIFHKNVDFIHSGERWSGNSEPYTVITAYMEDSAGVSSDQISYWNRSIDNELLLSSVTPKENAKNWTYTYAATDSVTFLGPKSSVTAEIFAVGGDFFIFHPMRFTYGSYFLNDESNPMGIVIDKNLAWKLFGAENIIGMELTVGDVAFTVVGVADPESDRGAYGYTYGDLPRAYISYAGYSKIGQNNITIYETTLPNYVDGFGKSIFDKAVTLSEDSAVISEASARYSFKNRFLVAKELDHALIRTNNIEYPYWENEAGIYDYYSAVLMIVQIILAVICLLTLLLSVIVFFRSGFSIKNAVGGLIRRLFRRNR